MGAGFCYLEREKSKKKESAQMSLLKSAWEIALERTEGIDVDENKIRKDQRIEKGRRLAGSFLSDVEATFESIEEKYGEEPEATREDLNSGIAITIISNLALPQTDDYLPRMEKIAQLAGMISAEGEAVAHHIGELASLMGQYLDARENLLERAKSQYQPMFEQKQQQMMAQYGRASYSSVEQDPEFVQFVQKHFRQLSGQYQNTLDQAKEELKQLWNIAEQKKD